MTNEQSGVKKTQARAEQALRELMLSGERISQPVCCGKTSGAGKRHPEL